MIQKRYFLIFLSALLAAVAAAQPEARFSEMRHDFGMLTWKTAAPATFKVTNTGNAPLYINDVHPDCGCVAVSWTRGAIAPGDTASIVAAYDAELLGSFHKQLAVTTNAASAPAYLTLSGEVVMERAEYSGNFAYRIGDIYLDTDNIEFDDVARGDRPEKVLLVYNHGKKPYRPELMHLPKYLTAGCDPEVVRPGRIGHIVLRLDSEELHSMGLTQTSVYLSRFPGDRVKKENEINVTATLLPDVKCSDVELARAPLAVLDSTTVNLGSMGKKKRLRTTLTLSNHGKSDLEVRALQVYNPGISVSCSKSVIKPGGHARLKISLNATSNYFKGSRRILLITNDPKHPKLVINITAKK